MSIRSSQRWAVIIAFTALPAISAANAGTTLMIVGAVHLLLGNFILGIAEGMILSRIYNLDYIKTMCLMLAANYLSAWLGGAFLLPVIAYHLPITVNNLPVFFWILFLIAYIVTIALEFPFVLFALKTMPNSRRKAVQGSLLVQTISCILLVPLYLYASETSLMRDTNVVSIEEIELPDDLVIFYLDRDLKKIQRYQVDTGRTKTLMETNSVSGDLDLQSEPESQVLIRWSKSEDKWTTISIRLQNKISRDGIEPLVDWSIPVKSSADSEWSFTLIPSFQSTLVARNLIAGGKTKLALETPFLTWKIRYLQALPGDIALFQLGRNQICLFDPDGKRLALVAKGVAPEAAFE